MGAWTGIGIMNRNAAFTPGYMLPDQEVVHLYPLVAVNMCLVSATKLSPVCRPSVAGYEVDRDIT